MKKIKILLIEDTPEDIGFVTIQLTESFGQDYTLEKSDYFSKALQLLSIKTYDVIILDLSLPDSYGLETFKTLIKHCNSPIIVYTGLLHELIKKEMMESGAHDYLIKGQTSNETLKHSIIQSIKNYNLNKK